MGSSVAEILGFVAEFRAELTDRVTSLITNDSATDASDPYLVGLLVQELERLARTGCAAQSSIIHHADTANWTTSDGARRLSGWISTLIDTRRATINRKARISRLVGAHPEIGELLASGHLSEDAVNELALVFGNRRVTTDFVLALETLTMSALAEPYDAFVTRLHNWRELHDADGPTPSAKDTYEQRSASIVTVGNQTLWSGEFDPVQGDVIRQVFEAFINAEYLADREHAQQAWTELGNPGEPPDVWLPRTPAQRRADAMYALAVAAATGQQHGGPVVPTVTVNVLIDETTFTTQLEHLTGDTSADAAGARHSNDSDSRPDASPGVDPVDPVDPVDRSPRWPVFATDRIRELGVCRLGTGQPVDPREALAHGLLYGHIRRVVYDSNGVIINLGRRSRCFTGSSREAAFLQAALDTTMRCSWPGCRRVHHLQLDHVHEHRNGGRTDTNNVGIECGYHNRLKTTGYRVWRDGNGTWHTHRPNGTEIHPT